MENEQYCATMWAIKIGKWSEQMFDRYGYECPMVSCPNNNQRKPACAIQEWMETAIRTKTRACLIYGLTVSRPKSTNAPILNKISPCVAGSEQSCKPGYAMRAAI